MGSLVTERNKNVYAGRAMETNYKWRNRNIPTN